MKVCVITCTYNPDAVTYFAEQSQSFAWDPPNTPPDIFNAAVECLAEHYNISTRRISPPAVPSSRASVAAAPLHEFPRPSHSAFCEDRVRYVVHTGGHDYLEVERLLASISSEEQGEWLLVSEARQTVGLCLPQLDAQLLRGMPYDVAPAFQAAADLMCEWGAGLPADGSNFWPLLSSERFEFIWRYFCERLRDGIQAYGRGRLLGLPTVFSFYAPSALARSRTVRHIWKTLPRSLRPEKRRYHSLLADAYYLDAELAERSGSIFAVFWRAVAALRVRCSRRLC